ncbi:MAG: alpha/beta fold hydrolase [Gammaproteobacteria bacterium]
MADSFSNGTVYRLDGPGNAPVVVLIHGLGLNRHIWDEYQAVLSSRYRVLTYDLYGHGGSTPPPEIPSLRLFSEQLRALLDALEIDRCAIVGFSLGGMINRRFAIDYPERVSALVILNSPHERSPEQQKLVEKRAADTSEGGPAATLDATIERWFTAEFRAAQPEVIAQVRRWVLANDPVIYAQCRQVLATGVIELIRPQPPVSQLSLVMTAENDSGSSPAMSHAIAAEIHCARTIIVPGLQHMALVEQPSLFIEPMLRFLQETHN